MKSKFLNRRIYLPPSCKSIAGLKPHQVIDPNPSVILKRTLISVVIKVRDSNKHEPGTCQPFVNKTGPEQIILCIIKYCFLAKPHSFVFIFFYFFLIICIRERILFWLFYEIYLFFRLHSVLSCNMSAPILKSPGTWTTKLFFFEPQNKL